MSFLTTSFVCVQFIIHNTRTRMSTICGELVCDSRKTRKWQCGTKNLINN